MIISVNYLFSHSFLIIFMTINDKVILCTDSESSVTESGPPLEPFEGFGDFHPPVDLSESKDNNDKDISDTIDFKDDSHDDSKESHNKNNISNVSTEDPFEFGHFPVSENDNFDDDTTINSSIIKERTGFAGEEHVEESGCFCRNDSHYHYHYTEVECRCYGESVTVLPTNLSSGLTRLSIISVGIEVLSANSFHRYENLTDLYMESVKKLRLIDSGIFLNLIYLRTVYIKLAPQLKHLPDGVFWGTYPRFKILRIVQTGLEVMPSLNHFVTGGIISMVDFDNNRIRNLTSHSIMIKAEIMNLDYNMIEDVENRAFYGSEIAKLSLKGNRKLINLQERAFEGLKSLRELDLSQTSIKRLPIIGLEDLEVLKLMDTVTLKEFPSVYHFKNIKEAHLTYPYHCCAFKFPATHDPKEYARYQEMFMDMNKRYCTDVPATKISSHGRKRRNTNYIEDSVFGSFTSLYNYVKEMTKHFTNYFLRIFSYNDNKSGESINDIPNDSHRFSRRLKEFANERGTQNPFDSNPIYGKVIYAPDYNQTEPTLGLMKSFRAIQEIQRDEPTPETFGKTSPTSNVFVKMGFDPKFGPELHDNEDDDATKKKKLNNVPPGSFGHPVDVPEEKKEFCGEFVKNFPNVKCYPIPDAFNPCEDVMGTLFLRTLVWLVAIFAIVGNAAVMLVLMSGRFTFNVSKFLMINLAAADLMMGVYLLIIASVDLHTVGIYFNYAIDWQHGIGCKIAGFITVFASELSIFTLTLITLERWFAITFAIQLNKRLKLGLAIKIMIGGWLYAIIMASLPLIGISSYSKTSICLPMENTGPADIAYLISLLTINGLAFFLISACYAKMYCSIISQETRATVNDMTIAKRMALLVFTDFVCWAPIAFFGLTAIAGYPLIDVPNSKFLLVMFYPLNSCANPFLYAILTKQYRRDFFILTSRYGFCTKRAMKYKGASSHGHHRVASVRGNNAVISGSIFSQVSCDGQSKHHYKYVCRGHRHHHGYIEEYNSGRSVVTVDIYPECSSRSNDSTHEIVKFECKKNNSRIGKNKDKKRDKRKIAMNFVSSSSSDDESSSPLHKGSPHPIRHSHTRLNRLPSSEQEEILKKILHMDLRNSVDALCTCRKNAKGKCSACIQRDSSSGEKSVIDIDGDLLKWSKGSRGTKYPVENASFVMSSHSNSANEDTEI